MIETVLDYTSACLARFGVFAKPAEWRAVSEAEVRVVRQAPSRARHETLRGPQPHSLRGFARREEGENECGGGMDVGEWER